MASVIKLKRSSTSGSVPTTGDLQTGEVAVNLFDRKLYVSNGAGVTAIGGEDFRLTSQSPSAGAGAYLKLLGDTTSTSNTVLLRGASGITVARDGNGSISFTSSAGSDLNSYSANTNPRITALETEDGNLWSAITATNTAIRSLVTSNDTDISNLQTEDGNLWSAITGTNTAIRALTTANATEIGDVWNGLIATNTAIRSLVSSNDTDISNLQTEDGNLWSSITATNTAIRSLVTSNDNDISAINTNLGQRLGATASVTLTGDITGTASFSSNAVSISTTYNNDVVLGTDTSGNYAAAVTGTANEIEITGSAGEGTTFQVGLPNDVTIGNNLTVSNDLNVSGDLTVTGATTYLSSSTITIDDGMFKLSANNAGDVTDTGVYAKYVVTGNSAVQYSGYFRDATDGEFKFYTGLDVEPTGTVNVADTGYTLATINAVIDGGSY